MKLAAIDIGTNSIHMIVVNVLQRRNFEVVDRVKEMAKLGVGVFATNRLSDTAYKTGIETIERYVQLADQLGVDDIITAATSATREAQNGEDFLQEVYRRTKIRPRVIAGKEEARLIFLAVRNAIALKEKEKALVLDIGGGSTEAVVGDREEVFFGDSMKLGVLRLLDMFDDSGPVGSDARSVLESHIQVLAKETLAAAKQVGFDRIIGTSGTIRTLGEAAYKRSHDKSLDSVNAEVVKLKALQKLTQKLIEQSPKEREKIDAISAKRVDAIHLGGILLVELLQMAGVEEITLCDASLREGLILDYLDRHPDSAEKLPLQVDLRHRKAAQLVYKYDANWDSNSHIAKLALQLFDQTQKIHGLGALEKGVLEYSALLHNIGLYLSRRAYHKSSRYILKRTDPRGFTDEEMLLIRHVVRYHRKAHPKKKHKKFRRLTSEQQKTVVVLAGLLRIAIGLDRAKDRSVTSVTCEILEDVVEILVSGKGELAIELWAAKSDRALLEKALNKTVKIRATT